MAPEWLFAGGAGTAADDGENVVGRVGGGNDSNNIIMMTVLMMDTKFASLPGMDAILETELRLE